MKGNGLMSRALASLFMLQQRWVVSRLEKRHRKQIVRELSTYNDRELLDLGFSRADFPAIANGTYRR